VRWQKTCPRKDIVTHMDKQEKRDFKTHLYEQFARIGKALSSAHRLELLEVLAQGEHSVEALAQETGMAVANASQHLQVLRAAQLVEVRREGVYIYYRLADERVFRLWQAMREVGEARIAEIERIVQTYLHERTLLQPISTAELRQRLAEGEVVLLDVRPVDEYQAAHLPGALSTPESTCYLHNNALLFTGDTLFPTSIGRPDLHANAQEARARSALLYHSLHKLLALPSETLVLPGHVSQPVSFDGVPIGARLAEIDEQVGLLHVTQTVFVETLVQRSGPLS
jgi:DNA-binding transcriptional ArsR family regulator/rhodanese-related sulfurtransferase